MSKPAFGRDAPALGRRVSHPGRSAAEPNARNLAGENWMRVLGQAKAP